jgi:hypothetical protein
MVTPPCVPNDHANNKTLTTGSQAKNQASTGEDLRGGVPNLDFGPSID